MTEEKLEILEPTKDWKRTICIDFDGVIAEYNGWKGQEFFGIPKNGAKEFLDKVKSANLKIVIFTIRPKEKILRWFKKHNLPVPYAITNIKIPAFVYVDDRGLKFNGDFASLFDEVKGYRTYWEIK